MRQCVCVYITMAFVADASHGLRRAHFHTYIASFSAAFAICSSQLRVFMHVNPHAR